MSRNTKTMMRSGMLFLRLRVVLLTVLVLVGWTAALAQDNPAVAIPAGDDDAGMPDPALELWRWMFETGMIDDAQYQHVLQHGHLPRGSTVQNSPVEPARQTVWQGLAERNVVTPEELAHMLFKGTIPNLTEAETKAFEELAPVYEPDRSKRLTYDVRRKHQRVELIRLAHDNKRLLNSRRAAAVRRAEREGIPVDGDRGDGEYIFLQDYERDVPIYWTVDNANAAKSISTDKLHPPSAHGFNLEGHPVLLAQWDGGHVYTAHQEFETNRVVNKETLIQHYHPTGVAGTMIARGASLSAKGMAPAAMVYAYTLSGSLTELPQEISAEGLLLSNHSYGTVTGWATEWSTLYWYGDLSISQTVDYKFGRYNETSRMIDEIVYGAIYHLPVWSAGNDRGHSPSSQPVDHRVRINNQWVVTNMIHDADGGIDGYDSLPDQKCAKNNLVVGAVLDAVGGYAGTNSVVMSWFSSFGPTDDGRVKPDIVANGVGVTTPGTINPTWYNSWDGTSFAAPSVTGSLGLLLQLHQQLHGTNMPMWASTIKALVIHTADECGAAPGPDYMFGWGLMNTLKAATVLTNNAAWNSLPHVKEVSLLDGDSVEFGVLATTSQPLRVTICWTDPPGPIQPEQLNPTNLVLINDLDLRVISPDGSVTNTPWVLDPFNPSLAATTGDNIRDNVEQVHIQSPTNGTYIVRLTHKAALTNGFQDVSIIITGNTPTIAPEFTITDFLSVESNLYHEVEWPAVVGGIYRINTSTNLMLTNGWTTCVQGISANKETMLWSDNNFSGSTNSIRFYRVERTR